MPSVAWNESWCRAPKLAGLNMAEIVMRPRTALRPGIIEQGAIKSEHRQAVS